MTQVSIIVGLQQILTFYLSRNKAELRESLLRDICRVGLCVQIEIVRRLSLQRQAEGVLGIGLGLNDRSSIEGGNGSSKSLDGSFHFLSCSFSVVGNGLSSLDGLTQFFSSRRWLHEEFFARYGVLLQDCSLSNCCGQVGSSLSLSHEGVALFSRIEQLQFNIVEQHLCIGCGTTRNG